MPAQHTYSFRITIDGTELPEDVEHLLMSAVVDDSLNLPDLFVLTFRDKDRVVVQKGGFEVGKVVKVSVVSPEAPGGENLITGEITALEAEYDAAGTTTMVRGLDHSHRLFRGRVNATYTNVTASDIARAVASRVGLTTGRVEPTTTVLQHACQANETDWSFLQRLATDNGRVLAVVDGRLDFRAPPSSSQAPSPGDLDSQDPLQLTVGTNVVHVRATVTSAEQVGEVEVRAYDPVEPKPLVGHAPASASSASLQVTPARLAGRFGNPRFVATESPYKTQSEVDGAARAIAEQLGGAFAEVTGKAVGNPRIKAGVAVSLGMLGEPFDGRYTCTTTRHTWEPDSGYTTDFTVSGKQERSLLGLASGAGGGTTRVPGMAIGIVTDVNDRQELGRVKVKLPTMGDTFETDFCHVVYPGAGSGSTSPRGLFIPPEVNDMVLVGFELGDVQRPFVLGGLYSSAQAPPSHRIDNGASENRVLVSRKGNVLVLQDKDGGAEEIGLHSKDGAMVVQLLTGSSKRVVRVVSDKDVEVEAGRDVKVKASGMVQVQSSGSTTVKATNDLQLEGMNVRITANGQMELKGAIIKLN